MDEQSTQKTNIFSETSLKDQTINLITDKTYTKQEVIDLLTPIWNYLELLSNTYDMRLDNGLIIGFRRPQIRF